MPGYYTTHIKPLSKKLYQAERILKREFGSHIQILDYIKKKSGLTISESDFSKMLNAYRNKEFISSKLQKKLTEISEILDELLKQHYKFFWNELEKTYTQDPNLKIDSRIEAFYGTYIAYNWDKGTSIKNNHIPYIHCFKMMFSRTEILCNTKDSELAGVSIISITSDRIAIEISNTHRKVFIIVYLTNAPFSEIQHKGYFESVYIDSGTDDIKTGIAIFERTKQTYQSIKPQSLPLSELEGKINPDYIKILQNTQLIL